jgi:hypothetical protein
VLITNDGATIMQHLQAGHPAAKMLVELSKSQDIVAGDGTTSVVILAGAFLEVSASVLPRHGRCSHSIFKLVTFKMLWPLGKAFFYACHLHSFPFTSSLALGLPRAAVQGHPPHAN